VNAPTGRAERIGIVLTRHWVALLVSGLLFYSSLPFLAPVLMKAGAPGPAQLIYTVYRFTCHTYAFRSFFLFGERVEYPRGEGDGVFERATGINPGTVEGTLAARDFLGNETVGYKVALCERDVAIYFAMALNGILFAQTRRRAKPLPWWLFILLGIVPIGLDGFSQLFSQPPLNLISFRESTWWLRLLTGALFGTSVAWLIFPLIQEGFITPGGAEREATPAQP